jgi:hypothetical protein
MDLPPTSYLKQACGLGWGLALGADSCREAGVAGWRDAGQPADGLYDAAAA